MSEIPFHNTKMGRQFFDGTLPRLNDQLKRVADALEANKPKDSGTAEVIEKFNEWKEEQKLSASSDRMSDLHSWVLEHLGDDERILDNIDDTSFCCGILASVDWLIGANSVLAEKVEELMNGWAEDEDANGD